MMDTLLTHANMDGGVQNEEMGCILPFCSVKTETDDGYEDNISSGGFQFVKTENNDPTVGEFKFLKTEDNMSPEHQAEAIDNLEVNFVKTENVFTEFDNNDNKKNFEEYTANEITVGNDADRGNENQDDAREHSYCKDPQTLPLSENCKISTKRKKKKRSRPSFENRTRERCDICDRTFSNKYNLTAHMKLHTLDPEFMCHLCGKLFNYNSSLTTHLRSHSGERPHKCPHCDRSFPYLSYLKIHIREHTGERPYKCTRCDMSFSCSKGLKRHVETLHGYDHPISCIECKDIFFLPGALKQHILNQHADCKNELLKSFFPAAKRKRSRIGAYTFLPRTLEKYCQVCDKHFETSKKMSAHMRIHSQKSKCTFCDKTFLPSRLEEHMRVHTGERPFKCDDCGKTFAYRFCLKLHLKTHTNDRPYPCTICGLCFYISSHLKKHLTTHNLFHCIECEKSFLQKKYLILHFQKGHCRK